MVLARFETFLSPCTANTGCELPFWEDTATAITNRHHVVRIECYLPHAQSNDPSHSYDNNNELGGTSFKARYKDWAKDPMIEDFSRWTAESFG